MRYQHGSTKVRASSSVVVLSVCTVYQCPHACSGSDAYVSEKDTCERLWTRATVVGRGKPRKKAVCVQIRFSDDSVSLLPPQGKIRPF